MSNSTSQPESRLKPEKSRIDQMKDEETALWGTAFIPGFTEFYTGSPAIGIIWTGIVYSLYITLISGQWWLAIPGLLIHLLLIYQSQNKIELYNKGIDPLYPDIDYEDSTESTLLESDE